MKTSKAYTFVIGSMDDFANLEDLMDYVEKGAFTEMKESVNYSVFEFDAPSECDLSTVQLIGYGYAFENDWCMDGTHSFFIEGTLARDEVLGNRG